MEQTGHPIDYYRSRSDGYTHAWCNSCNSNGKVECSDGSGDPERDFTVTCGVCGGRGMWRVSPLDVLEKLRGIRNTVVRRNYPNMQWANQRYGELRQQAMSPLNRELP